MTSILEFCQWVQDGSISTAIRESIEIIRGAGANPAGVLLALDRQERAPNSPLSAVQEVRESYGIPVLSVMSLEDLMAHMAVPGREADLQNMRSYRARYGLQTEA